MLQDTPTRRFFQQLAHHTFFLPMVLKAIVSANRVQQLMPLHQVHSRKDCSSPLVLCIVRVAYGISCCKDSEKVKKRSPSDFNGLSIIREPFL